MKIAFIVYDGMTLLDFVGVYDPVVRLRTRGFKADLEWDICARTPYIKDINGVQIASTCVPASLGDYDAIIVPGGINVRELLDDPEFMRWLKTAQQVPTKISVCSGALLLGAAGFLDGKKATTHPASFSDLKQYSNCVLVDRIVHDGNVITARGVTASIDLGLYLCELWADKEAKEAIRKQIDYRC